MTIETDIVTGLFAKVATMATLLSPQMTVQYPDVDFNVPTTGELRYLEVSHFPNEPVNYDLANDVKIYTGILQIGLIDPTHLGSVQATKITSQIVAQFAKGTEIREGLAVVKIERTPAIGGLIQDGQRGIYPVSVRYRCSG